MSTSATVRTVLGDRPASDFSIVSPHEHILSDSTGWYRPARDNELQNPLSNADNLVLAGIDQQVAEVSQFADEGGLIVECTVEGMGRDLLGLREVARQVAPSVSIVAGTGWYVDEFVEPRFRAMSEEDLTHWLLSDIAGESHGIRPGVIGEIGTSAPVTSLETRFLIASAAAQSVSGLGIQVHLDGSGREGVKVLEILDEGGADLTRVSLSHLDDTRDDSYHRELAAAGCFLEFDAFGADWSIPGATVLTDRERVETLLALAEDGWADSLLVAQDVWLRQRLRCAGGKGYGHLSASIKNSLDSAGLPADSLMRRNPLRFLTGRNVDFDPSYLKRRATGD